MKEFEKWLAFNWDDLKQIDSCPYSNLLKVSWRAALLWVLDECTTTGENHGVLQNILYMESIEEELNG